MLSFHINTFFIVNEMCLPISVQDRTYKGRFWKVAERPEKEIDSRLPGDEPEPLPF